MTRIAIIAFALSFGLSAEAQEQQAGNEASTDTEGTFQALVDACDDTDALMLRARIRLQLPRTTDEAAATAQQMLEEAFATCGSGDLEGAKTQLAEALEIAEAGATENFGTDVTAAPAAEAEPAAEEAAAEDKPWWRFW